MSEREIWRFVPLTNVGPLTFGTTHAEVEQALQKEAGSVGFDQGSDVVSSARFSRAVATYYADGLLRAVAIDANRGPQVQFEGVDLVGQRPSEVDRWLAANYADEVRTNQEGVPCLDGFGLVLRVQRSGDFVLTRPVFVAKEWAQSCGDVQESLLPDDEWRIR